MINGTITHSLTLVPLECYKCGLPFAFPDTFKAQRLEDKETFYCPNGHPQHYTTSRGDRLQKELEEKQRELVAQKCETLRHQQLLEAEKAAKAKLERRCKHGVCPCCKRTFVKLANHIAKAHPEFGPKQKRNLQ